MMILKISFSAFLFASDGLLTKVLIKVIFIWLLIELADSANPSNLETIGYHPPENNVKYNNILFRVKVGSKLLFRRCVLTWIFYQR